ncbi:MAG TPA: enoyl-CoA hydratase/isomerase family protein [Gemmatimonadales bacterium]|nr:enoyl-CoA hydratase/isomerase family protein [Gemmatimonadales bacterium]
MNAGGAGAGLRVHQEAGVAHLVLARPERRNALNRALADALADAIREAGADESVRVIAISAEGQDFCAGADLAALERLLPEGAEAHRQDAASLGDVFLALRAVRKPTVAIIRGRALAGGAGLATACDLVIAHELAQFGYPEVRIGFVPAMVMTMLRRAVGEKRAFDLVGTGRTVDAREAERIGLVSRVIEDASFDAEVSQILESLSRTPPGAMAFTKSLLYELDDMPFSAGIERGIQTNVEARMTDEFRDGVNRFLRRSRRSDS